MIEPLKLISIVGARPNFMKMAPLIRALHPLGASVCHLLVHTGQHYDHAMAGTFFEELAIPKPDIDLGVGSGSHAEQVGRTMIALEPVFHREKPDGVIVVGDVNATCAAAVTAKKEGLRLIHIEAGLRSFDNSMPEEINRIVTDRLADLLLTPDRLADEHLRSEGVPADKIACVGNIMIDTLDQQRGAAEQLNPQDIVAQAQGGGNVKTLKDGPFAVMTLHRPANVDDPSTLRRLVEWIMDDLSRRMQVLWPLHPRTRKQMDSINLAKDVEESPGIIVMEPLGYRAMLRLNLGAAMMVTDSGGLQEECCVLGTPCAVVRPNTERPVTLRKHGGTCVLVGDSIERLAVACRELSSLPRRPFRPPQWDGHTAERIVERLLKLRSIA